jgi:TatD DNase family protein
VLVDTHAHLQWASFDKDRKKVMNRARKANVLRIVNVGFDLEGCRKAIDIAEKYEGSYATVGIHPHNSSSFTEDVLGELTKFCENPKVLAIGEIGLDFYRNLSPREAQIKAFKAQLLLAEQLELPIVIHNRNANSDIIKILSEFKGRIRGIMHCFSGNLEIAEQCLKLDFYISFAGTVTYPNSFGLHEVSRTVPLDRILLETDSPWLAPQNLRGKRNEPSFLPFTATKIAMLRGISPDALADATTKNAEEILHLP